MCTPNNSLNRASQKDVFTLLKVLCASKITCIYSRTYEWSETWCNVLCTVYIGIVYWTSGKRVRSRLRRQFAAAAVFKNNTAYVSSPMTACARAEQFGGFVCRAASQNWVFVSRRLTERNTRVKQNAHSQRLTVRRPGTVEHRTILRPT